MKNEKFRLQFYFNDEEIIVFQRTPKTNAFTKMLVKRLFEDKTDLAGEKYYGHLDRVSKRFEGDLKTIALLHDTLEDTNLTKDDLLYLGFKPSIVEAIEILTRREKEDYSEYIERIITSKNTNAMLVKLSDLNDNMNLKRLKNITDKDIYRFNKYQKSFEKIKDAIYKIKNN